MSEVTKASKYVVLGAPGAESVATKVVKYVMLTAELETPPRRIVHGKISYNKRMT